MYHEAIISAGPHDDVSNADSFPINRHDRDNIIVPDEGRHAAPGHFKLDRQSPCQEIQSQLLNRNWGCGAADCRSHGSP